MWTLKNEKLELVVDSFAAQMLSLKEKGKDEEYLWQGDPKYWTGRNPTLFPMVGSTYNKKVTIDGKDYFMKNHGFARNFNWNLKELKEDEITLSLPYSEETLNLYPFKFELLINYKLVSNKVEITYTVINLDEKKMPYNFGLHPGFNCPISEDEKFEDYSLIFEKDEETKSIIGKDIEIKGNTLELKEDFFIGDNTIVLKDINSEEVTLKSKKHSVKVTYPNYQFIAFWKKEGAPYICIEPWISHGDFGVVDLPFEQREGTRILDTNSKDIIIYSIEIN